MPLEQHPTDPDKLVFRAHQIPCMYSQDELDAAVAAERERVMQIVQSMKADLEAKFEKSYMEGVMAGAAAEREAIAQMFDDPPPMVPNIQNKRGGCLICGFTPAVAAKAIRARGETK